MNENAPDLSLIQSLLIADFEKGSLIWKERTPDMFPDTKRGRAAVCATWNTRYSGKEAFNTEKDDGYRVGKFKGTLVIKHRVIWALHNGRWPETSIDHINGKRDDNRICNLREASAILNARNSSVRPNNKTGIMGVRHTPGGKYHAGIRGNGKQIHLGTFETLEEAFAARKAAEKLYGYPPECGRPNAGYCRR